MKTKPKKRTDKELKDIYKFFSKERLIEIILENKKELRKLQKQLTI